jgi:hypothetical protein
MHDVKNLLGSVVEEPAAKSEKVSIDLIFRPKFFEFVKRSIGFFQQFFGFFFDAINGQAVDARLDAVVALYLNRRLWRFTALKSWTGNLFTGFAVFSPAHSVWGKPQAAASTPMARRFQP